MGNEVKAKSFLNELRPGIFNNSLNGITFFAEKIDSTSYQMHEIFMKFKMGQDTTKAIMSEEGHFDLNTKSDMGVGKLVLGKGQMLVWDANKKILEKFLFQKYEYPLPIMGEQLNVSVKASFLNKEELDTLMAKKETYFQEKFIDEEMLVRISLEYLERYTLPISIVLFSLLGSVLGGVFTPRAQKNKKVLYALLTVIFYYILYFLLVGLSKKFLISPWIASLTPLLFLLAVCIFRYPRLRWSQ